MPTPLYRLLQWTWGLPQTLLGALVWLFHASRPRFSLAGAAGTEWDRDSGLSLGMFLFVPRGRDPWFTAHEYGHTLQSLLLGPLYLPLVGLPSLVWSYLPRCRRQWRTGQRPYDSVYPENWATRLGRRYLEKGAKPR